MVPLVIVYVMFEFYHNNVVKFSVDDVIFKAYLDVERGESYEDVYYEWLPLIGGWSLDEMKELFKLMDEFDIRANRDSIRYT